MGGATAANEIATAEKKARRRRKKCGGLLSPNMYTFGAILACVAWDGNVNALMRILCTLEKGEEYPNVVPNHVIYSTVISACTNHCAANGAAHSDHRDGVGSIARRGIIDNNIVDTALEVLNCGIRTLGGYGGMGVVGYNAVILTMAQAGRWRLAMQMLGSTTTKQQWRHPPPPSSFFESPPLP